MSDLMTDVIAAGLDDLKFHYARVEDEIHAGLTWDLGMADLVIREVERPGLIWLRVQPHIFVDVTDPAVMAAMLAANYAGFFLKCGRDPRDGEVVFDLELPSDSLSKDTFVTSLKGTFVQIARALHAIVLSQIGDSLLPRASRTVPAPPSEQPAARAPLTDLEREVAKLLEDLD